MFNIGQSYKKNTKKLSNFAVLFQQLYVWFISIHFL